MQRATVSDGERRVVVADPSFPGAAPLGSIANTAALVLAAIPVVMAEVVSEVTLAAPPLAAAEEERETRFPASSSGGLHGSPSRSELEVPGGDAAGMEVE